MGHVGLQRSSFFYKLTEIELKADYMEGIESVEEWLNVIRSLVSKGYSDGDIEKIIGGNALRVIKDGVTVVENGIAKPAKCSRLEPNPPGFMAEKYESEYS